MLNKIKKLDTEIKIGLAAVVALIAAIIIGSAVSADAGEWTNYRDHFERLGAIEVYEACGVEQLENDGSFPVHPRKAVVIWDCLTQYEPFVPQPAGG